MLPGETIAAVTIASYSVGIIAERHAVNQAAEKQARLLEATGPALRQETEIDAEPRRQQLSRWASRNLLAPLALTAAVAGGVEASGWVPAATHTNAPPALEVVVDRSGATRLPLDGKPAIGEINSVVSQLQGIPHVTTHAEVAIYGEVEGVSLGRVKTIKALGDAPLEQATQGALDRVSGSNKHDAAVVVITNGNSMGSPGDITSDEARSSTVGVPVFVVNVEAADSPAINSLQNIAKKTHGTYWNAHKSNVKAVAKDVKHAIAAGHQEKPRQQPAHWPDRIFGGIALLAAVGFYRRRKSYTLGKGPKGE